MPKEETVSHSAGPPGPPSAGSNAESLARAYASAYEAKDPAVYLSLFSRDADYYDFAVQVHANIGMLKEELRRSFQRESFRLSIHTYFVSSDGRFAALQGTYSDIARGGEPAAVPIVSILEFGDGEITKESLYYDGSLFKRHFHAA
jgi:ketosteroid isomerase-like protein